MKKVLPMLCCAAGGVLIGLFANQLHTVAGAVCFTLGVALLVGSIFLLSRQD